MGIADSLLKRYGTKNDRTKTRKDKEIQARKEGVAYIILSF
jgi:hypothetical protein